MVRKINYIKPILTGKMYDVQISAYDHASLCRFLDNNFNLSSLNIEMTYLLCYDENLRLSYFIELSRGTYYTSCVNLRLVINIALSVNSHFISLVHNHPDNDCTPSELDKDIIVALDGITNLSVKLLSHIIITKNKYYDICSNEGGEY